MIENTLGKFYENDVKSVLDKILIDLEEDFQKNKDTLKKLYLDSFKEICTNIKELEKSTKGKTGFIIYTLLRTKILQHKYVYRVIVYDKDWYLNDGIRVGEMDVGFFYKYFEEMWQKLLKASKKYVLKISEIDVERIMLGHLDDFHKYLVELMRYSLIEAIETKEYLAIEKEDILEIQAGEYYEPCDIIHMEHKEKNYKKIKKWLKENERQSYCFQDFRGIDLRNLKYNNMDLRYTDFRDSHLDEVDLSISLLMGTKFKNSTMIGANLMLSMIHSANFEKVDMTGANLQYCVAFTGKNEANQWKKTGFTEVSFKDSILKKANFTEATIIEGNFLGADLTDAIFEQARLYRSKFSKDQLKKVKFTKEQLEQIEIIQ
ncbi:pentapeptide repeat-containing protein [Anaerophilus nitritogenes]|uniref:pentapeptide repeat-containing protein n=1 Tax=Anaerophilus nitritogenes TaxID=2498136 RepID=UPI00101CD436|nr:pentapeptide repeat-containing protein [Anaerophilus nitritogenes]